MKIDEEDASYLVIKFWEVGIVKEVMTCDIAPVAMFYGSKTHVQWFGRSQRQQI